MVELILNMKSKSKYILAVPNISDGRRKDVIEKIITPLKIAEKVNLIGFEPEYDFNRTVIYVFGEPEPLKDALIKMAGKAYKFINMEEHEGSHPRIGALDVIPLIPFKNSTLEDCCILAEKIGEELFKNYQVPIYFSGENARNNDRKELSFIRKGQYEGLKKVAHTKERKPDLGPARLHNTFGATIISSSSKLAIAYNVILDSDDLDLAKRIARSVRGPSGGFSTVRAIGVRFPEFDGVVVSINLFDCYSTPIYRIYEFVKQEANRYGVRIKASEIVGPIKLSQLLNSLEYYLSLINFDYSQILETHLSEH